MTESVPPTPAQDIVDGGYVAPDEVCSDRCALAQAEARNDPGRWVPCDFCDRKYRVAPPHDNFKNAERRTLRDMACVAGWIATEATPSTWVVPGRADSREADDLEKRVVVAPTPRKEGIVADMAREDAATHGYDLAQQLRALTVINRECGTALRIVAEKRGASSPRTAAEVIGEQMADAKQKAAWTKSDGRVHGPTYWSGCAGLGKLVWERAVRAWMGRER